MNVIFLAHPQKESYSWRFEARKHDVEKRVESRPRGGGGDN